MSEAFFNKQNLTYLGAFYLIKLIFEATILNQPSSISTKEEEFVNLPSSLSTKKGKFANQEGRIMNFPSSFICKLPSFIEDLSGSIAFIS